MLNPSRNNNRLLKFAISPEGTAKTDGAKLVSDSMAFGRAVGFTMENGCLIMRIDERHTGKQTAFDVLEEMMRILHSSTKETVVSDSV